MDVRERPGHGYMAFSRRLIFPCLTSFEFATFPSLGWSDVNSVFAVRGKDSVESGEIDSGLGHQSCQPRNKIHRLKNNLRSAIAVRRFEFVAHLACRGE